MALPVTIASTALPANNYYCGPFKAPNQQIYIVLLGTTTPDVFMATDPTSSFASQDTINAPNAVPPTMWAYMSGSEIHIATAEEAGGGDTNIDYHVFDTASDTWTTTDESIESGIKDIGSATTRSVSIAVRSDGDVIVLYNGDPDNDMGNPFERVDYARKEATWTTGVDVGGTSPADEDRVGAVLVRGSADNMHFFWSNQTQTSPTLRPFYGRSLDASNSLGTERVNNPFNSGTLHALVPGIHWQDGATERVVVPFDFNIVPTPRVWGHTESSGALADNGAITSVGFTGTGWDINSFTPVGCSAVDGDGRMYLMWARTDGDLYRDSALPPYTSWGTDIEVIDATTITQITCNVYPRDGEIKLAFVYEESGDVKYNEVSITAPTAPAMAASRFPDQNYKIGPFSV